MYSGNSINSVKLCIYYIILLVLLLVVNVFGQEKSSLKSVTFKFQPVIGGVQNVYIAGTFNDWIDNKDRLSDEDGNGIFEITLLLSPGRHEYKFVVDGRYLTDMNADEISGSGRQGDNSVINVDERFDPVNFKIGDNQITTSDLPYRLNQTMANVSSTGDLRILGLGFFPDLEKMILHYSINGAAVHSVEMISLDNGSVYEYFSYTLKVAADKSVKFILELVDGSAFSFATPAGYVDELPDISQWYLYTEEIIPPFKTPAWVRNGVFYQIFPERFRNGDRANDPDFQERYYKGKTVLPVSGKFNGEYFHFVKDWYDVKGLTESLHRTDGRPDYFSFYGGDIAGVLEKLEYLHALGISIIYFNPLNQGKSNHKYDPVDYLSIDAHFGDEEIFKIFVDKAHSLGIKIIVDKAFNHTGDEHYAFVDSKIKGVKSKYWDWYEWAQWPLPEGELPTPCHYYSCWWDFPLHPNLNFDLSRANDQENIIRDINQVTPNVDVVNHILEVADFWIGKLGVDGFRLDVPNEVPFWMWEKFRTRVDSLNPEAFLIAEIWGNAMPWLGPKYFHSTMNYKYFREPVINFFALNSIDAAQFNLALVPGRYLYPLEAAQSMMNLIGSHDTKRFLTQAGNDLRKLKLAALFQMTYPGVPAIYYGDEVGLAGGDDPDNRRTFPWNWKESEERMAVHGYYQTLMNLRNQYAALRTGKFKSVFAEGMQIAYLRSDTLNSFLIIINNADKEVQIDLDLKVLPEMRKKMIFLDLINCRKVDVNNMLLDIVLAPYCGTVIKIK